MGAIQARNGGFVSDWRPSICFWLSRCSARFNSNMGSVPQHDCYWNLMRKFGFCAVIIAYLSLLIRCAQPDNGCKNFCER